MDGKQMGEEGREGEREGKVLSFLLILIAVQGKFARLRHITTSSASALVLPCVLPSPTFGFAIDPPVFI